MLKVLAATCTCAELTPATKMMAKQWSQDMNPKALTDFTLWRIFCESYMIGRRESRALAKVVILT